MDHLGLLWSRSLLELQFRSILLQQQEKRDSDLHKKKKVSLGFWLGAKVPGRCNGGDDKVWIGLECGLS
jgi:hypothetical protein